MRISSGCREQEPHEVKPGPERTSPEVQKGRAFSGRPVTGHRKVGRKAIAYRDGFSLSDPPTTFVEVEPLASQPFLG